MSSKFAGTRFCAVVLSSLALHGGLLWVLQGQARAAVPRPEPVRVTVRMAPIKTPEPVAEPPAPVVEAPEPAQPIAKRSPRRAEPADAPKVVSKPLEPNAAPSEPVDFTGLTLTSPNGAAGWASMTGNGQAMNGPLSAPARAAHAGSGRGQGVAAGVAEGGTKVVGLGSLSRPPRAPSLDGALVENYPRAAREQGQPGRAVVRARILPDGRVGDMRVLVASAPEFGRACQRTLSDSRWSAPLDKGGQPVATDVSYTCQFEVTR